MQQEGRNKNRLFALIKKRDYEELTKIIENEKDIDVNVVDDNGIYLISFAIQLRLSNLLEAILKKDAKVDIVDLEGHSLLYYPIRNEFNDMFEMLLRYGERRIGISIIDVIDQNGAIPLHYSIVFKRPQYMTKLFDAGSNIYYSDKRGFNAIHLTIEHNAPDMLKMLILKGIDIDTATKSNGTLLHIACSHRNYESAKLLIESGIQLNMKTKKNELSELHISLLENDLNIFKLLLDNGADINIQDHVGFTVLHDSIMYENTKFVKFILDHYDNKINYNLYTYDGMLPIHILSTKIRSGFVIEDKYFRQMLIESSINFQNDKGESVLNYLCKTATWKEYISILSSKKINLFIRDTSLKFPYQYVDSQDISEFLDMVGKSYSKILDNKKGLWPYNWQNANTIPNVKDFIEQLAEYDVEYHGDTSLVFGSRQEFIDFTIRYYVTNIGDFEFCLPKTYPTKTKRCFSLKYQNVELCTFTGSTLDSVIGIVYLVQTHTFVCAIMPKQIDYNEALLDYYKISGKLIDKHDFINFEIIWVNGNLFLIEGFEERFNMCLANESKYIIIPIGIEMAAGEHSNFLIVDKSTKEMERFEPYGKDPPPSFNYNTKLLDTFIKIKICNKYSLEYISPSSYMPKIGFQYIESFEPNKKKIGDPDGFCALWSIWYVDMRLTYPSFKRQSLIKHMVTEIKSRRQSFRDLIRNYSGKLIAIRDDILQQNNINVNDWLNDNYSESIYENIRNTIVNIICKESYGPSGNCSENK